MRNIYALLLCCLFVAKAGAQTISATTYPFSNSTGATLADLSTGATGIIGPNLDDPTSAVTNIGFDFWFNGVRYTKFSANGNGLMRLGNTVVSSEWSNSLTGSADYPLITAYWDDTWGGTTGGVFYKVTGTAPNRVLVVEWRNITIPRASDQVGNSTYQVWLSETTGKIEFVYGTVVAATDGYSTGFASSSSQFASVTTTAPSCSYSTANDGQTAAIASGVKYTFTPLIPSAPTGLSFTSVLASSMVLNWTDNATNEVGYAIYQSTDGVNYTFIGQTAANATSYTATTLNGSTLYYYKVYAVTEGGMSSPLSGSQTTAACGMSGTIVVGPTGAYATLAAAITALQTSGTSGAVTLELQTTYAGETFPITIGFIPCAATNPVTIRPQGTLTITGTGAPMFDFNGAQYVTIDGRVGSTGTTKALTLANTSTSGQVIRFINGASNNTIKYCTLNGVNTSTTNGMILFSTTNTSNGNSNNLIDNCDILNGSTTYVHGIYSSGTTGFENSNNTVSNCNIANYFLAGSATTGINLTTGNTNWTISNNRFYQTATRTYTSSNTHRAILISNSATGNGFVVTGNTIGYGSSSATGTYSMTGTVATTFRGIELSVGTASASSVQGNTITGISVTGTSGIFTGILVTSGFVNVGTVTGNTIGSGTATGAISTSNSTTTNAALIGINSSAATPSTVTIQNNIIGGLTTVGSTTSIGAGITGIQSSSSGNINISNNTIGSTTTANSINSSTAATGTQIVYGINCSVSSSAVVPPVISGNTISNLNGNGTGTAALVAGILHSGSGAATVSGNTVKNISGATTNTVISGQTGVTGIAYTGGTGSATIIQNTINAISNTNTGSNQTYVSGIGYTSSVNGSILRNRIYDLRNASTMTTVTTAPAAIGIFIGNPGGAATTIANNMISIGDAQTTNTVFAGIMNGTTTSSVLKVYYNTVNIQGAAGSGTLPTMGFHRGNFSTTAVTSTVDIKNNIFNNIRTGSNKNYAIANGINVTTGSATGWATNASNYNILNAASANVGFWTADQTLASWRTTSLGDGNSYSGATVTFANAANGDLHINMGTTANSIESHGTPISGLTTDYDNDSRPGPAGSVNGGGLAPDLGADEFDGVGIDDIAPIITYSPLSSACTNGDRTFTATIADQSGVPAALSGSEPRVYYKKGVSGTWVSRPGTLTSGTVTNGTWTFSVVATDMGGLTATDNVFYYVTAQDVVGTPNIAANPSLGFTATSVTSVTTPPTTPNNYFIGYSSGTYSVGVGQTFATVTSAINSYNGNTCLTGPVTFLLTDANYSGSETFPITVAGNPLASSTITLTIKPASGVSPAITGSSSTAIFKFNGADYVTIDGSNAGTTSKDLTITNTNTGTSGNAVVWIASASASDGATNNTIKNCVISGNASTTTEMCIFSGGTSGSGAFSAGYNALTANSNNTIQNNTFMKSQYGVWLKGTSTSVLDQVNQVKGNSFGTATTGEGFNAGGLVMQFQNNATVSNNDIQNVQGTGGISNAAGASTVFTGLYIRQCTNALVSANKIFKFNYQGSGANRTHALYVESPAFNSSSSPSNNTIVNNAVYDARVSSTGPSFWTISGISANGGYGDKFYYNTVNLTGAVNVTAGPAAAFSNGNTETTVQTSNINVRDNIFVVNGSSSGASFFASYWYSSAAISASVLDYNDLSVTATGGATGYIGYDGTNRSTLSNWQAATSQEANSINNDPIFVSANDPHLQPVVGNVGLISGTPIAGVTTDIDGTTRSSTTPVRGAHEVNIPTCSGMPAAGTISASVASGCSTFTSNLSVTGSSVGIGLAYQWRSSPDNITFTDIAGATDAAYTATVSATTYYIRNTICTLSVQTAPSPSLVLTLNTPPAAITGATSLCPAGTVSLSDVTSGGTWTSSNPAVATVNSSGVVTGVAGGGVLITYTIANGCTATSFISVSPAPPLTVSASPAFICSGNTSTLSAVSGVTNYSVYTSAFAPEVFTPTGTFSAGSTVSSGSLDDGYFTISLPFDFRFWGTNYPSGTNAFIGTNGHLAFGTGITTTSIGTIPNTSYPSADIVLFGRDLNLNTAGSITYGVNGTAPNRKFIVSYNAVPDFGAAANVETGQMVISEGSGEITFHITTAQATSHTIGVQNAGATLAATIPGQNASSTPLSNSSWSFVWPQATTYTWTPSTDLSSTTINNPVTSTTATVTYTVTGSYNGCITTASTQVSVNPTPAAVTGTFSSCVGGTSALGNTTASGAWSSSNATVASVSASGLVTANAVGTAIISYTVNSCTSSIIFTVNSAPGTITGPATVCTGLTATLANPGGIGSWTSSNPAVATVGATSGVVSGVTAGTTLISYINGCGTYVTTVTSVLQTPSAISGATGICLGSTATLSNTISGGTWSSGNASVATVSTSGVVSGVATGLATISYDLGNGCPVATQTEIISNITPPVSVTVSANDFCAPGVSTLTASSIVTNYTVNTTAFGPVSFTPTGTFNPSSTVSAGSLDDGYFTIALPFNFTFFGTTYTAGSNAYISTNGNLSFGTGISSTSMGTLPNTSNPYADIALFARDMDLRTTGSITYGTTGVAPNRQFVVSYNAVPDFSSGVPETGQIVLNESTGEIVFHITTAQASTHTLGVQNAGATTAATVPGHNSSSTAISNSSWSFQWPVATSYTWSPATNLSATTGSSVTASGVTSDITYTVTASFQGCTATEDTALHVKLTPAPISGIAAVCESNTLALSNTVAGGTWESSDLSVATIDATTGVLSGVGIAGGTTTVSYTLTSTGCRVTDVVTVNPRPSDITGTASVCVAAATSLASTPVGGTWSSTVPTVAGISSSGLVSGNTAGLSTISYMLSTGCFKTRQVTVNPLPVLNITPSTTPTICQGESVSFAASSPLIEFPVLSQDFNGTLGSWTITSLFGDAGNVWRLTTAPYSDTAAGVTGDGTQMMESAPSSGAGGAVSTILASPSFSTVGFGSAVLSFNENLFSTSSADVKVAVEYSIDNGSTWAVLLDQMDSVIGGTTWSASAPEVSIPLPSAALNEPNVKLRWNYQSNFGLWWDIDNVTVKGALPAATFTWAGVGIADGLSCTSCDTATITPTVPGVNVYSVTASSTCSTTGSVTVNVNPAATITGNTALLCTSKSITLSASIPGGTWAGSNAAVATVDATAGVVSGISAGSIVVTYTTPTTACPTMVTVNVNQGPQGIAGSLSVCQGFTTTLSNSVSGGTWSSSNTTVATIDAATGVLSGLTIGSAQISYVMPSGCFVRSTSNVRPVPNITGSSSLLCTGSTIALAGTITGGTWVSSDTSVATVDFTTGVVSGVAPGSVVISYTLPTSCGNAVTLNVNQAPGPVSGALHICEGLTTALGNSEIGGTWSSSDPTVATINSATGLTTAVAPGTSNVTYTLPSGCQVTDVVTVDQAPTAFTGGLAVCEGLTTTLSTTPAGGAWISSAPATANVDITTGVVTGVASGTANITYTSTTGCQRIEVATVNALPVNITGTVSVCQGLTTTLVNTTGGGTWSSGDITVATIDAGGVVSGVAPGTAIVSYTLSATGCYKTTIVTVNALPDPIPGPIAVCEGLTTTLSNTPIGGTWGSSDLTIATIDATTGVMSGVAFGTTIITYMLPTGCISSTVATVNPVPVATTGTLQVCVGLTTNLVNTTGGGTWSSDNILVAGIDATGMVTGNTIGTANILYTLPTGCLNSVIVTVNPLPNPITGPITVCEGLTTTVTNTTPDGTWSSSTPTIASIDALTGVMSGVAFGTTTITYTLATGCIRVADATVNALPAAITGVMNVCAGSTTTLFNTTPSGTWSNDLSGNATVASTGIVSGVTSGTASITYTVGTGCLRAAEVTVNVLPTAYSVTGGGGYCAGTSGAIVGLANSELNVNYDLFQGSTFMGSAIGSGSAISFGSQSVVGTYTVFATNALTSCASSMAGSVTVSITPVNIPSVTLSTTSGVTTVCSGIAITYTATPVNGGTLPVYNWEINGSPVPGATSATYSYIPSSGDIVKVTLNSNEICAIPSTATDMLTMTVNTSEMPVATISTPTTNVCAGSGATFSVVPSFGGTTPSYEWFVNGIPTTVTGTTYTYAPNNGDVVTVKMGSNFTCRIVDTVISNSLTITTTPIALPIVSLSVSPSAVFMSGTTVTFSATVSGVGGATPSYKWLVNGVVQAGATGSTFTSSTLNNNDSVTCKVNVSVPCGFENFNSIVVKVKQVGVSQVFGEGNIRLVPNPNQGEFTVKGTVASETDEEVFVEVVDMLGQIVYKGRTVTRNGTLNERIKLGNTLANGMYMLNLRTTTETAVFHFVLEQ